MNTFIWSAESEQATIDRIERLRNVLDIMSKGEPTDISKKERRIQIMQLLNRRFPNLQTLIYVKSKMSKLKSVESMKKKKVMYLKRKLKTRRNQRMRG